MRLRSRLVLLLLSWTALAGCSLAADAAREGGSPLAVTDRVYAELNRERVLRGQSPLVRPAPLDAAAQRRAQDVAALDYPRRMNRGSLKEFLSARGITRFSMARERLLMLAGYDDPARQLVDTWRDYPDAWNAAMAPDVSQVGLGWAQADDGYSIFLAIFVQPLHEYGRGDLPDLERHAFEAVNRQRQKHGLAPLAWDPRVAAVARGHSQDMAARHYFSHEAPGGAGPAERTLAAGLDYRRVAENIARNHGMDDPVGTAVESWMNSAGHRENILNPGYVSGGVGIAVDDEGTVYFTELFYTPMPAPAPPPARR